MRTGEEQAEEPAEQPATRHRLASWFREWRRPIRHWLSRRSSVPAADLDDVAQEVFLRLLRYGDDVIVDNPQGYLFRIAANVASEWRERARMRRPHDQSWLQELQVDAADEPENAVARFAVQEQVQAAVERLPPRQRVVLLLHVNDGLTYQQIAQQLGLSYRAVLRDLTRAYSQLRMQLSADDP